MPRLYLVRHGRAAASYAEHVDPGLDAQGAREADEAARKLAPLGPLPILTSPLARARETAAPLARLWKRDPRVEPAVAEIPSPGMELGARTTWLRAFMAGSWAAADAALGRWRDDVVKVLVRQTDDVVIFSHFIAINVAVGAATARDEVVLFLPANASITILETDGAGLSLIEKGREAQTKVN